MTSYPVNLNLAGAQCLVVGGGAVGERKVMGLLPCSPSITVISPALTEVLLSLAGEGKITHLRREYERADLEGYALVFAATNDEEKNIEIASQAKSLGILVNAATSPELSSFSNPTATRRGRLLLTVSTEGLSPALSKRIREEIERMIGPEYEMMTDLLGALREPLKSLRPEERERRRVIEEILSSRVMAFLRDGRYEDARDEVERITGVTLSELGVQIGDTPAAP